MRALLLGILFVAVQQPAVGGIRCVSEWGVLPTATPGENATALNAAYRQAFDGGFDLSVPPGDYKFAAPIVAGYHKDGSWQLRQCPALVAATRTVPYAVHGHVKNFPIFRATHDGPLFVTQSTRGCYVRGIMFHGGAKITQKLTGVPIRDRLTEISLYDGGRQNRWSPSALIAIDPFGGVVPESDRYPTIPADWYSGIWPSSRAIFEQCVASNSEVGALIGAGVNANSDGIVFRDCVITFVKYGFSVCHTQTKNIRLDGSNVVYAWAAITGATHGLQQGRLPIVSSMLNAGHLARIIGKINPSVGPIVIRDGHFEVIGQIGNFGGSHGNHDPVLFEGVTISGLLDVGVPHIATGRPFRFVSGSLRSDDGPIIIQSTSAAAAITGTVGRNHRGSRMTFVDTAFRAADLRNADVLELRDRTGKPGPDINWIRFDNCQTLGDPVRVFRLDGDGFDLDL